MSAAEHFDWLAAAEAGRDELLALRRAIHAEPELGLDCPQTRSKLEELLAGLPLKLRLSANCSGFIAILDGARPGRTVLLRGDMDALPIEEATSLEFASRNPGRMHACGHDSHSAMLASAAQILSQRRDEIAGRILFMFQPGEEGYHGARIMLEEGLLGDPLPYAAFALHIWPTLAHGAVACRAGAMLASTDTLSARIIGKGGHAAMPHDARDPVPVAAEIILALQSEVARRTPVTDPIVLSITKISAGTTHNVLPDAVELLGTLRTLSPEARSRGHEAFERICTHVAVAHGCSAEVEIEPGYPPTVNDARAVALVREISGDAFVELPAANMGGEDFSYVLEKVPGAMAFLGVAPESEDPSTRAPLHNPAMTIDEAVLPKGAALHRCDPVSCGRLAIMILAALAMLLADPSPLAGFYMSNQMEIGAALELDADGKFQYQLDYGAVSESAEGNWSTDGRAVYLTATKMDGAFKTPTFNREPLKIEGDRLVLNRYDTVIRFDREELPTPADKK